MTAPKILMAAVEPSADALGAALLRELHQKIPGASYLGCGGPLMEAEGFTSAFDTSAFSVMGFTDVARVLPEAWRRARQIAAMCAEEKVDAAVFVDGWSFSRLAAKRIRKRAPDTKIVKFAAPQVWASRPQRTIFVRDHFDLVLTLLPFEPPYFHAVGVDAKFVGNPNFEAISQATADPAAFRARHGLDDLPILAVLPGSRRGEVQRLLPPFRATVEALSKSVPGLSVVIVAAPAVETMVREIVADWSPAPNVIQTEERFDAYAAADVALAASGTVTTELAISRTPMVVAYRVDPLTAFWARRVITTPYVSILNVAAEDEIIPERLQEACTPEILVEDLRELFLDQGARARQTSAFDRLLPDLLGAGNAASQSATAIASLVQGERRLDFNGGPQGE